MGQGRETVEDWLKISEKYDKLKARSFGWPLRAPLECCLKTEHSSELFSTDLLHLVFYEMYIFFHLSLQWRFTAENNWFLV